MPDSSTKTGSCMCGAVTYQTSGNLRPVVYCHCIECRKATGHHMAATALPLKNFALTNDDNLTWFTSSDFAKRGFCKKCGSQLFFKRNEGDTISITAGTFDGDCNLDFWGHIYTGEKGCYYEIPQNDVQYRENSTNIRTGKK